MTTVPAPEAVRLPDDHPVEVAQMLVLSTAHLRERTCNWWLEHECQFAVYPRPDIGWFVYAADDSEHEDVPNELRAVLRYAREHGMDWILFDCDANVQPGLPTFIW